MNPILACIFAGEYRRGWELFARLEAPAPEDLRWAGVCAFNLQRFQEAKNLLLRALGEGCAAAAVELSTVYRHLDQLAQARAVLDGLEPEQLGPFDRCLALREEGVYWYTVGQLRRAAACYEEAWAQSYRTPLGGHLRPFIGQSLGYAYADLGLDRKAAEYFRLALEGANPAKQLYIRLNHALSLTQLRRFEAARAELALAEVLREAVPAAAPFLAYCRGALEWAQGRLREAGEAFGGCVEAARAADEPETECYGRLGLAAVETARGVLDKAEGHLRRARQLASNPKARAFVTLREGALLALTHPAQAQAWLGEALEGFQALELWREAASAHLHLAEACLRSGDLKGGEGALREAVQTARRLESLDSLGAELRYLRYAQAYLPQLPGGHPAAELARLAELQRHEGAALLELYALGRAALLLNGQPLRLQLRRAPVVLYYLLRHEEAPKARLLLDLFPDEHPQNARRYFHQVRYALQAAVPGLEIPFDKMRGTYRLQVEGLQLWCDAVELRRTLGSDDPSRVERARQLYRGPLLEDLEGDWVEQERVEVARMMIKVGLETIEGWLEQGEFDKCLRLAAFLLEVEPGDEVLLAYLSKAGEHIRDLAAGRRVLDRLVRRLEADLGEVPPELRTLCLRMQRGRPN